MDSHERLNRRAIEQEWMLKSDRATSIWIVLLVVLSSFAAGLMPLAFAPTQENAKSTPKAIAASEAGVWSVFGEKQ